MPWLVKIQRRCAGLLGPLHIYQCSPSSQGDAFVALIAEGRFSCAASRGLTCIVRAACFVMAVGSHSFDSLYLGATRHGREIMAEWLQIQWGPHL
jgi:hypothetical protein